MARTRAVDNKIDPGAKAPGGRPKLMSAGVEYRGPGQYRARKMVDVGRILKTFDTNDLAAAWLKKKEVELDEGTFVDRSILDKVTVREVIQFFVDKEMQIGGKRRGAAEDRGHVPSMLTDRIATLPLSRLTASAVEGFKDRQEEAGFAPATIVKRLNLLSRILSHAIRKRGYPMANPATAQEVPRPQGADVKRDRRLEAPTPAMKREAAEAGDAPPKSEEDILIEFLTKSKLTAKWPDDVPMTRLALAQAMRQGELAALRVCDINFDAKKIVIRGRHEVGTKTGEKRKTVRRKKERGWEERALMRDAIAILKEHLGSKTLGPNDRVFSVGGSNAFKVRFGRVIDEANKKGLLLELTFHDLRHEATSRLAKLYENPLELMRVTGHMDIKSLNRYYHPDLTEIANRTTSKEAPAGATEILKLALAAYGRGELSLEQLMQISKAGASLAA